MSNYTKVLFVVTEKHMMSNYNLFIALIKTRVEDFRIIYVPSYNNVNMISRILKGRNIMRVMTDATNRLCGNIISETLIIYSNAEGYILNNRDVWMPKLVNCKEVLLQHGDLPTKKSRKKYLKESIINFILFPFPRYMKYGGRFGDIKADMAILWGSKYKDFFCKCGWDYSTVLTSGILLRSPVLQTDKKNYSDTCLFLIQGINGYYGITDEDLKRMIYYISRVLSQHYMKVIVRKHPKMSESFIDNIKDIPNTIISKNSMAEEIAQSSLVVSFFSSGLVDAYISSRNIIAIRLKEVNSKHYEMFEDCVDYDKFDSFPFVFDSHYSKIKTDYLDLYTDINSVVDKCLSY